MTPRGPSAERYTILSELGRGGMGVVHAAFDNVRRQPVALKRLSTARFSKTHELERATTLFEREYHTLSQLAHPHVISVFDYGIDEHGPFYTMEQLRGDSLRARAPLHWREAARSIRDVASALAIVHSRRFVHRDVTPHNIYCDPEHGAKLFDFGAMIPMGVAKQLVGTPAFIAPECLQAQSLDGQTDLFSLGACLYYVLSGRHAFAARGVDSLAQAWQKAPLPLSRLVPEIPEALEALVESLLSLSPSGRPRTAADVYERLTSIADLPRSESDEVVRAYVTKPALVGRDRELEVLRRGSRRAANGRGGSIIIASSAGLGRTRLLDAGVLEARLEGLRVVRADASDSRERPLGAILRLISSLQDTGVDVAAAFSQRGLEGLLSGGSDALLSGESRERTLRELTSALLDLSQSAPLAIAIDDAHALDEPSLAVLASLAAQVRGRALFIVATLDAEARSRPSVALRLLWESSRQMELRALDADQSRTLLSSVFGDAPNLEVFGALSHRRSFGNPRLLMESAQAAIDAKLARYEGGGWAITGDTAAIANTLDRQTDVEGQLAALSADALELLEAMALDREAILGLVDYPSLTEHADSARMHRALSELIAADWLVFHGDRARFRRGDQQALVAARVPASRARTIHGRIAERCLRPELAPVYRAFHLFKAGELERALQPMEEMSRYVEANAHSDILRSPITFETLELFSDMADIPQAHPGARANYLAALVVNASYQGFPERAAPRIEQARAGIAHFTGVSDYRELSDLPDAERLNQALLRANERCQSPGIGGLDLVRSMRRQTQLCITSAVCAIFMADPSLLDGQPDLRPFVPLSPALAIAARLMDGLGMVARGQTWRAWDVLAEVHGMLFGPSVEALDGLTLVALRVTALGYLSSLETEHASPNALHHIEQYASLMPHSAQSFRARYHLACGDLAGSAAARKQSELLSVQSNSMLETRNTESTAYALAYALFDDGLGLRRVQAEIAAVATTRPGWRYRETIAKCQILRCQGRYLEALEITETKLAHIPCPHPDFVSAASTHLELLLAAERFERARRVGLEYLERARAGGVPSFRIELALADAHAELGEHDAAERFYSEALCALEQREVYGLLLGRALETGARIALRRADANTFVERADRCALQYAVKQNPLLAARIGKLMRDAARAGLIGSDITAEAAAELSAQVGSALLEQLASNPNDSDFYTGALAFLVKRNGARGGFLYLRSDEGLRRVASTESSLWTDTSELDRTAAEHYARELLRETDAQALDLPTKLATVADTAGEGDLTLWPCTVSRRDTSGRSIEGVVVFVADGVIGAGLASRNLEQLATLMTRRAESLPPDPDTVSTTA